MPLIIHDFIEHYALRCNVLPTSTVLPNMNTCSSRPPGCIVSHRRRRGDDALLPPEFDRKKRIMRRDRCEEAYWKLTGLFPLGDRIRIRTVVTAGKPANEIVRMAREQEADLIMLGSLGQRSLRRPLRSMVTDRVMRNALVPVIAVNAQHRGFGGAGGGRDDPSQRVGGGRVDVHGDEMARTVTALGLSCRGPEVTTTASPKVLPPRLTSQDGCLSKPEGASSWRL